MVVLHRIFSFGGQKKRSLVALDRWLCYIVTILRDLSGPRIVLWLSYGGGHISRFNNTKNPIENRTFYCNRSQWGFCSTLNAEFIGDAMVLWKHLNYFHLNDSTNIPKKDTTSFCVLCKGRPITLNLLERWRNFNKRNMPIDEHTIPTKY